MSAQYPPGVCGKCDNCVTCNGLCDTCNVDCDTSQTEIDGKTCKTFRQFSTFNFSKCYNAGEIIGPGYFDGTVWQEIINHYNTVGQKGALKPLLGNSTLSNPSRKTANNDYDALIPFSAQEFQRIASAVGYNNSAIRSDALIKGSYFKDLVTAINNLRGLPDSCDRCNANCDCDAGADSPHCDSCQGCVSCQANRNNNCKNACCGCDSCETACEKSCQTACQIGCLSGQSTPQPNTQ